VPALSSFDYAVIRVVPRVERGEFINAGIVLFCLQQRYLRARVELDETRLRALWRDADVEAIRSHLDSFVRVCEGDPAAGPVAQLGLRERFHWLVAPRSTTIQVSPVHSGLCVSPDLALTQSFDRFVRTAGPLFSGLSGS
jgi:hypothetical protein